MNLEAQLKHYRLTRHEYDVMVKYLGHTPNPIEWALYSALWSEHCSYKSSKIHLKKLFTKHPRVVQGPGENAGVIDLGQGERVAFKMESHNHPSFIEPTQGAATGVGGILRDIFTMGARPIASMDYLCFGEDSHALTPKLLDGVVKGIGGYGNCVGVPTVSGQTTFHRSFNGNILVNAFSLGLFRPGEEIFYGKAAGVGNLIVYAGARTGRDGIHGAAMASESFDTDIEKKKPNVQIGDPFFEKLLIEACLEVMKHKLVVGLQDMGAAGLTSSTFEMAARAKSGLRIDLKKVPLREPDITPEEILLSESQERMVLVVEPRNWEKVRQIFERWDLSCTVIGEITAGRNVELYWGDQCLANVEHQPLVEKAPVYERPFVLPASSPAKPMKPKAVSDLKETVLGFLSHPAMTSRLWITRQYDQRVGAKTISACEDGVALLRLPDSGRVLAMNTGCRPLLMKADPAIGGRDAIVLPALQMAARGARALAVTDCLNFGNPEKKEVMGEFVAALQAMDEACRAFDVPIISGNVSLYNETLGQNIIGTPATGLVGLRDDLDGPVGRIQDAGLELFLVRTRQENTWMGEYAQIIENVEPYGNIANDLTQAVSLQRAFLGLAKWGRASQIIGRGGLLVALIKIFGDGVGARLELKEPDRSTEEILFAERFYCGLWAVDPRHVPKFLEVCKEFEKEVAVLKIGVTQKDRFSVDGVLDIKVTDILSAYHKGIGGLVESLS